MGQVMRLALRILINILNNLDAQLDQVENELRPYPAYRVKFQLAKKQFRSSVRAFAELNDSLGDDGIN